MLVSKEEPFAWGGFALGSSGAAQLVSVSMILVPLLVSQLLAVRVLHDELMEVG